jgi:hypothetical protein
MIGLVILVEHIAAMNLIEAEFRDTSNISNHSIHQWPATYRFG